MRTWKFAKEDYAVERRIAPSAKIEEAIEAVLLAGLDDAHRLSELGRLGAQLVLHRAVEEEVTAFLGRARYERTPEARGSRNGVRPRRVQTAEGEITVAMPQVRDSLTRFVSTTIPDTRTIVRTRPLEALVIGAYVRGLSDRDIESLAAEAGLGRISRTTVSGVCRELRDRYRAFRARNLAEVRLVALFMDAIYLPVRPEGPKEGVLVAWGFTTTGERVLLDVCLGQRERLEDWLDLGRGLTARGLPGPLLVVADGAPGLIRAVTELWPESDRQRCTVHRLRNVLAKLPKRDDLHARIRAAYWAALDGAASPAEAETGLRTLVGDLEREYPSAAACLAEDLPALTVHLAYPLRLRKRLRSTNLLERSLGEVRRRTKVIGRFPGESSCLTLAWAVMDLVIAGAKGLGLTLSERHAIATIVADRAAPRTDELVA
jgi:transposase-like protein